MNTKIENPRLEGAEHYRKRMDRYYRRMATVPTEKDLPTFSSGELELFLSELRTLIEGDTPKVVLANKAA
jgi:hypothetical protein